MTEFNDWLLANEASLRLGVFLSVLSIMALAEILAPRRPLSVKKSTRWLNNLGLVVLNSVLLRVVFPAGAVGVAVFVSEQQWGLLHWAQVGLDVGWQMPYWLAVLLGVVLLDLLIYLQHVLAHALPMFWRLHQVHHADPDYDLTTGLRFHPIEILVSMLIKLVAVVAIGAPVIAVVIFEVVLNASAIFNHSNVRLPLGLDRVLRLLIVTPDMHRVHHSVHARETNSNFGFALSIWDRLFGTYTAQPRDGHDGMTIGLTARTDPKDITALSGLLRMPFRSGGGDYDLHRRGG